MTTGDLPIAVIELISNMRSLDHTVSFTYATDRPDDDVAGPGFTLPENLGELDPTITNLNLWKCCVIG